MYVKRVCAVAALLLPLALGGCKAKKTTETSIGKETVRGKVTYNGKTINYGCVIFHSPEAGMDPKTGQPKIIGVGIIGEDGGYEITGLPEGPVMISVSCDPDVDPMKIHSDFITSKMQPPGGQGMPRPPMPGGGAPQGPPMPGGNQGPPMPGSGPPQGLPIPGEKPMPEAPMPGNGQQPTPKGAPKQEVAPPNPALRELSESQRKLLMEVHAKYGSIAKSPLAYGVKEGEQTHNIELK